MVGATRISKPTICFIFILVRHIGHLLVELGVRAACGFADIDLNADLKHALQKR